MNKVLKVILLIMLLSGLFVAGCSSDSTPAPAEGDLSTYQLEITLLGEKNEFPVDSQGKLKSKVEVSSADGKINLSIDKDTIVLDKDGEPLQVINAITDPHPPLPPEDAYIIGLACNLGPQGATFDPQLKLTLSYELEKLPKGVKESDLYLAYYGGTEWSALRYKKIDTKSHSVTTHVYHFTTFAILAPKEPAPPATPTQGTKIGNLAPNFQLYNLEGKSVSLGDLRGEPVLINFWATRCPPCVGEMPDLQKVYDEWSGKGLVLLAINIGESLSQVKEFLQSQGFSLPVLLDTKQDVAQKYSIRYIPTTFFIDKDGLIQYVKVGAFINVAEIEKSLGKIMP